MDYQIRDATHREHMYGILRISFTPSKGGLADVLDTGVFCTEESVKSINLYGMDAIVYLLREAGVICRDVTPDHGDKNRQIACSGLPVLYV